MRKAYSAVLLGCSMMAICLAVPAMSAEPKAAEPKAKEQPKEHPLAPVEQKAAATPALKPVLLDDKVFKSLSDANKPAEMHQILQALSGDWTTTVTLWLKPGAAPEVSSATAKGEMIVGQRVLSLSSSGMLNLGGRYIPFEDKSLISYNGSAKTFTAVTMTTLTTDTLVATGPYSAKDKTLTTTGRLTLPGHAKDQAVRTVLTFTAPDVVKREVYTAGPSGKDYKALEIEYRKKR